MKVIKTVIEARLLTVLLFFSTAGCNLLYSHPRVVPIDAREIAAAQNIKTDAPPLERVTASAIEQTTQTTSYDPAYVKLDYPNGDVPIERGVCADVIVRAFRKGGVDLQQELHEDMKSNFRKYPQKWGAKKPDRNIDHRRVPNLMTWFERRGKNLPLSKESKDYQPGDVVAWELDNGLYHIGLVSKIEVKGADRPAIVHNIGSGAKLEDVLFAWKIIGHYRYF
jgi:uncharacterized protein YijF (DUF1287 family)